jgi:hypothetical protein
MQRLKLFWRIGVWRSLFSRAPCDGSNWPDAETDSEFDLPGPGGSDSTI